MDRPFLSVILAVRDAASILPRCLESLAGQSWRDFEVVIQDGVSDDATREVTTAFVARLPCCLLASEPDTGIFDAWNKALSRARGEWILFLGADDALDGDDALAHAVETLGHQPAEVEYLAAPVFLTSAQDRVLSTRWPSRSPWRDIRLGMPFPHQGLFHRCTLFVGRHFDASLRIVGDHDLLCRTLTPDNLAYHDRPLVRMGVGGVSSNLDTMLARDLEFLRVVRRHFPGSVALRLHLRIVRAAMYQVVKALCGRRAARSLDDAISRVQGKA